MAQSTVRLLFVSLALLFFGNALAATKVYDFRVEWMTANPDGQYERAVMGINGQWPIPDIHVTVGDRLIVNVHNALGDENTSLHFHGLFQNGTTSMDGPNYVTQCPIPPGSSFTYNFTIDQPGTYWYHSHQRGQYPDGLRGAFLVHDPKSPYEGFYDEEIVLPLSDWYHERMPILLDGFISVGNPTGAEPVPQAALMDNTQNKTYRIRPGRRYFFRIINMAAFAAQYVWFEGHQMQIVEVDGVWTEAATADMIYITAAQRYGVIVTAHQTADKNFAIVGSMDQDLFDAVPPGLNPNVTSYLVYDESKPLPKPANVSSFNPFDDFTLVPHDRMKILPEPDRKVLMTMEMGNLGDGANYAFINSKTYVPQKVPTLYTALTTGNLSMDPMVYGEYSIPFVLEHNQVVEIAMNNNDPGKHPFHLHGHNFQAVVRSPENSGAYHINKLPKMPEIPMRRDTFMVNPNGFIVLRFVADNPGIWLYHCHIEWHVTSGLIATFVEAPMELQKNLVIPEDHYAACRAADVPFRGNAAGNTEDLLDLQGQSLPPAPLPAGFTAGGIVALVFSCISAFLGLFVIGWYGAAPIGNSEFAATKKRIQKAGISTQ